MTELQLQNQANMLANQERVFKLAEFLSSSDIIPSHFKNKPANVFIALEMANRLNVDFFEMANAIYVVHGKPGFSGAFTIGRINGSGIFKTKLNFATEGTGNNMQVTAFAESKDGVPCSATVSMATAITEGWAKNVKYKTMPEQMLTYRAAGFFCRKHCPQVLMGAKMVHEIEDQHIAETVKSPDLVPALKEADDKKSFNQKVEKLKELHGIAMRLRVDEKALAKLNLGDQKKIDFNIDCLETMIADKKEEKNGKPSD